MKKIDRFLITVVAAIIIAGLLVAGCAKPAPAPAPAPKPAPAPAPAPKPPPDPKADWPEFFQVTGGRGIGIAVGPVLAKAIEDKHGIPGTFVQPPGGGAGAAYLQMIVDGKAHIAVGGGDIVPNMAFQGTGLFAGKGPQPIRGLMTMYVMGVTFMTRANSGIESMGDIKGKRILSWYANVPPHIDTMNALLKFHGMTKDDVVAIPQSSIKEANEALLARTADVTTRSSPERGSVGIEELAKQIKLRLLPVTQEELDFVIKEVPYISRGVTIKSGTFTGQDEDVLMVAYMQSILVHRDLPDNFVYELMKIMMDSAGPDTPGDYEKVSPSANWTLNGGVSAVNYVPLHPGAIKEAREWIMQNEAKFYRGAGVPMVLLGDASGNTEGGVKMVYFAFQQRTASRQLDIVEQVKKVKLKFYIRV